MWSGPRNISTALMRSFGNRPDCYVTDEPLYAFYLDQTGLDHPGRAETLAQHETDWRAVTRWLTEPVPGGKTVWYQKHMAHHLLPPIELAWLETMQNCFLIRDPGEMLASLVQFIPEPQLADTGLPRQREIFDLVRQQQDEVPVVLDGRDVLENPSGMLSALCERLRIPWTDDMLAWPAGRRETDGAWADHWYAAVYRTTGFEPWRPRPESFPPALAELHDQCLEIYQQLAEFKIVP